MKKSKTHAAAPAQKQISEHGIVDHLTRGLKKHIKVVAGVAGFAVAAVACYGVYEYSANAKYQKQWGGLFVAGLDYAQNQNPQAIADYAAQNPGAPAAAYADFTLAAAYYQNGDYARAQEHFKKAVMGPGKDMAAMAELGLINAQIAAKSYVEAIAQADAFAAKYPGHYGAAQAQQAKALALDLVGRASEAKEVYTQLIAQHPGTYYAALAQMRLDTLK